MTEFVNLETVTKNLQNKQTELRRILTKDVEAVRNAILPWQQDMKGYLEAVPYKDFGSFLRKIIKLPINTRQQLSSTSSSAPLVVGRNFYYRYHGKKKVLPDEAMFCAFSKQFADLITTSPKRNLVLDFLKFKLAMVKYLEPFTKPFIFPISIPVESTKIGFVAISDGIVKHDQHAKAYTYLASQETLRPKFLSIYFTEYPEFHNQTVDKATSNIRYGNVMDRNYAVVISLLEEKPERNCYTLLGSTVITLNELNLSDHNKRDKMSSLNMAELQLGILNKNFRPVPVRADLDYNAGEWATFAGGKDDFVEGGSVMEIGQADQKLKVIMPNSERVDLSKTVITNWSDVIALPEVQDTVQKYLSTWNLINRAWSFMKQKYAYKVFLHGHF